MAFMILRIGFTLLPLLLRLAVKLRLGIPLLYGVLMLTVFHGWYQVHSTLDDGILFVMVGLATLFDVLSEVLEDMTAAKAFTSRVRQPRFAGESIASTEGLW